MFKDRLIILTRILVCILALQSGGCLSNPTRVPTPTITPKLVDESWLIGKPCSLPCWHGIEPGISTKDEAINKAK